MAAGEEGAGEVADGGDDVGEVVAAFPEAVVGGLVAEDLVDGGGNEYMGRVCWEFQGVGEGSGLQASVRPLLTNLGSESRGH